MIAVSLGVLLVGLLLGVFSMLYGTEHLPRGTQLPPPHERKSEHIPAAEPSPLFNVASAAAFAVGFGITGYLVTRFSSWSVPARIVVAAGVGVILTAVQSLLIARWAIPSARAEQVDERYLLQGTIGRVTRAIPFGGQGEMQYIIDGRTYALPARALDSESLELSTEVVIDRVENGTAWVEIWSRVEQRL